eukprot:gene10205-11098_t
MNALPDVIYREIFSYIPYVDHISLSMVDKVRCDLLLKRVRIIQINKKAALYFTSQEFRDKIKSLIVDPYHQLSMRLFHPKIPEDFDAFSCSELAGLSAQILSESLIPYLQKVRRLDLYAGSSEHHPSQVIDWINSNPSLSLKELEFSHFSMTDFPLIDQLSMRLFHPKVPQDFNAYSCSELAGLDAQQLCTLLIPYLQKVRRLELSAGFSQHHPSQVIDWINSNPSLSLKESSRSIEFSKFYDSSQHSITSHYFQSSSCVVPRL